MMDGTLALVDQVAGPIMEMNRSKCWRQC